MESALSPREIQTRIRSGESVDDVAHVAGIERDRVERFAAPVIAEREHVAGLAMTSSARRRGETSSHRTLRGALTERLLNRGVDLTTLRWDSYRLDDGRWAVTADYASGETPHQALFYFDLPGRYSVAGNDEGRWILGDTSPSRGQQPGQHPPVPGQTDDDTEPTVDLSDELALVRAIQDVPAAASLGSEPAYEVEAAEVEMTVAEVVHLNPAPSEPVQPEPAVPADAGGEAGAWDEAAEDEEEVVEGEGGDEGGLDALYDIFAEQDLPSQPAETDLESAEPTVALPRNRSAVEDSRPSDASAVPELSAPLQSDAWEPAIVVDYPVEPSAEEDDDVDGVEVPEGSDTPGRPEAPVGRDDRRDEATALEHVPLFEAPPTIPEATPERQQGQQTPPDVEPDVVAEPGSEPEPAAASTEVASTEVAGTEVAGTEVAGSEGDQPLPIDVPEQPTPPAPKPARRKRASVPSWDEIVFGGPKEK